MQGEQIVAIKPPDGAGEQAVQDQLNAILAEYLGREEGALELIDSLAEASQTFDDLADGDRQVTYSQLISLMNQVFFRLQRNPFYQRNWESMQHFLEHAVICWRDRPLTTLSAVRAMTTSTSAMGPFVHHSFSPLIS